MKKSIILLFVLTMILVQSFVIAQGEYKIQVTCDGLDRGIKVRYKGDFEGTGITPFEIGPSYTPFSITLLPTEVDIQHNQDFGYFLGGWNINGDPVINQLTCDITANSGTTTCTIIYHNYGDYTPPPTPIPSQAITPTPITSSSFTAIIEDSISRDTVPGVYMEIYEAGGNLLGAGTSDADGRIQRIELNYHVDYHIILSKTGYHTTERYMTINGNVTSYVDIIPDTESAPTPLPEFSPTPSPAPTPTSMPAPTFEPNWKYLLSNDLLNSEIIFINGKLSVGLSFFYPLIRAVDWGTIVVDGDTLHISVKLHGCTLTTLQETETTIYHLYDIDLPGSGTYIVQINLWDTYAAEHTLVTDAPGNSYDPPWEPCTYGDVLVTIQPQTDRPTTAVSNLLSIDYNSVIEMKDWGPLSRENQMITDDIIMYERPDSGITKAKLNYYNYNRDVGILDPGTYSFTTNVSGSPQSIVDFTVQAPTPSPSPEPPPTIVITVSPDTIYYPDTEVSIDLAHSGQYCNYEFTDLSPWLMVANPIGGVGGEGISHKYATVDWSMITPGTTVTGGGTLLLSAENFSGTLYFTVNAVYSEATQTPDPGATIAPTTPPTPKPTPDTTPIENSLGDVNHDDQVDIVDALLTAQFYVGLNPIIFYPGNGDINCDGVVDIIDALLIAQYYVGLITGFC